MKRIPLRTRLGLNVFRLYRALQSRMHELNYLFWECTLRCNLDCIHCGSDCRQKSGVPDMPVSDFIEVLHEVAQEYNPNKVMIALTGGEPLLRPDLEDCGKEFHKLGFPWGMVTNGYLLDAQRLSSLCRAGLRSVTVSLDGLQESHNWMRGKKDSYPRAMRAIELCSQLNGLAFDVVTCANQRNISELHEIKEHLIRLGVKNWRLFTIFPKGRAKGIAELTVLDEQFADLLKFIGQCRTEGAIQASYGCEGFLGEYEGKVRDGYFFCRAGVSIGSVLADGSISACPSLRGDFIQGNIYKDSFIDCWNTRYGKMRNRTWAKSATCSDCSVFKWCGGNGLHLRDEKTDSLLTCHYEKLCHGK